MNAAIRHKNLGNWVTCIVVAAGAFAATTNAAKPRSQSLVFEPLAPTYASFDEIEPILVNVGASSVFFPRYNPLAVAYLQRLNETSNVWEEGSRPIRCGTGTLGQGPLELPPGARLKTHVYWRSAVDQRADGAVFSLGPFLSQPLRGTYRLVIEFAADAENAQQGPAKWLQAVSQEFTIRPKIGSEGRR